MALDRVPNFIAEADSRIATRKDGLERPEVVPGNIRNRIDGARPSAGLGRPDPQLKRYLNLMKDNVETGAKEMERITASVVGPLAQGAPFVPLVAPTAHGAGEGRLPDNSITDFDPKAIADMFRNTGKVFSRSGIARPGVASKFSIGGGK